MGGPADLRLDEGDLKLNKREASMSSPPDRTDSPDEPSPYAPKWVRDAAHTAKRDKASRGVENFERDELSQSAAPAAVPDEGVVIERFPLPRSLQPRVSPEPPPIP